eukprot:CAMPEP_0179269608 /NCGR_PEP_ID=MMETSP0797-20121207/31043_1 /TAXON_ID=47934 /ORGANISM="Dinophysis acuminata, Strain DAEP01" /LENGTH=57 /DNA_ID=CAMNT_0020977925 /DNA_START=18 /DNA_END=188 /DNA_ORIENTATION=-
MGGRTPANGAGDAKCTSDESKHRSNLGGSFAGPIYGPAGCPAGPEAAGHRAERRGPP